MSCSCFLVSTVYAETLPLIRFLHSMLVQENCYFSFNFKMQFWNLDHLSSWRKAWPPLFLTQITLAVKGILSFPSFTPERYQQPIDSQWLLSPSAISQWADGISPQPEYFGGLAGVQWVSPHQAEDLSDSTGALADPGAPWWASESAGESFYTENPGWVGESTGEGFPQPTNSLGTARPPVTL